MLSISWLMYKSMGLKNYKIKKIDLPGIFEQFCADEKGWGING